ncbi:trans-sialidase [Trypanosoma cruzi]|nr:trans-sialidase [Trypanosoma cruzi]
MLGCRAILSFGCLLSSLCLSCTSAAFFLFFHVRGSFFFFACLQTHNHTAYMLQCSLMLLVHSVLAAAAFRGNEKERCTESASWLSSPAGMLHGVWRYCSEMPHHHARGLGTEWKISFCVSAAVGVGAAASDLSARWPQCVAVALFSREICCHAFTCVVSGTMCWRLCGCRMEGEERKEVRERRGQESRCVSRRRGHCSPNSAPLLSGIQYHTATS